MERRVREIVLGQDGIEGTLCSVVAKLDIGYVEGNRIPPFRDSHNLVSFHEQEDCFRIDEPFNEATDRLLGPPLAGHVSPTS